MAMQGMGTEVQYKMYLPRYSSRDLNDSAAGSRWPSHHESKTFEQHYGIFNIRPAIDGCMEQDKEQMRQTILQHETIFRQQLHELHRLYRRQTNMMNEVVNKEPRSFLNPLETSRPNLLAFPYEDDKKKWQALHSPLSDLNCGTGISSVSEYHRHQSYLSSIDLEKKQSGSGSIHHESMFKHHESLHSKCNKIQRRLFDLELPADKYANDEEEGQGASAGSGVGSHAVNRNWNVTCEGNANVSNHSRAYSYYDGDASSSNIYLRTQGIADLNKSFLIEEPPSAVPSVDIPGKFTGKKHREDLSASSHSGFQHFAIGNSQSCYEGKDEQVSRCNLQMESERRQKGWLPHTFDNGHSVSNGSFRAGGLHSEYFPAVHERSQCGSVKAHGLDKNQTEQWKKKKIFGVEISEKNQESSFMVLDNNPLQPLIFRSNVTNSVSSSLSSWKPPPGTWRQNLVSVKEDPSFNIHHESNVIHAPEVSRNKLLADSNVRCDPSSRPETSSQSTFRYVNGISDRSFASTLVPQHGPRNNNQGSCWLGNAKHAEERVVIAVPPKMYQKEVIFSSHPSSVGSLEKEGEPLEGFPWLRAPPLCNETLYKERVVSNQMILDSKKNCSEHFVKKAETMKVPSQGSIEDSSSMTNAHDGMNKRIEGADCSRNKKILGVPIFEKCVSKDLPSACFVAKPSSCGSETNGAGRIKVELLDTDLNLDPVPSESEDMLDMNSLVVEKRSSDCSSTKRHTIDLNVSVTEEEGEWTHFHARKKVVIEIDLEAPAVDETEVGFTSGGESLESKVEQPFHSSKEGSMNIQEGLVTSAAEALIAISSFRGNNIQEDTACHCLEEALPDTLQWFAEVISSSTGGNQNNVEPASMVDGNTMNGLDYFEYMTLNLSETEIKERCYEPSVVEDTKEEITLPRRPRRGQARRGRQRKDFQRDVLPSIASLSRNDVTEDIQTIEVLIRETGGTWQSRLSHRNSPKGRGGRGRKRAAAATASPTTAAAKAISMLETEQRKCEEMGSEETRLAVTGWGKRTRRPPRQRCPINHPLPTQ